MRFQFLAIANTTSSARKSVAPREASRADEQEVVETLSSLDPVWEELFPAEQERLVQLLVRRVEVGAHGLDLELRSEGMPRRRSSAPRAHSALVLAVVRGHRWKELLESGRYPSISALAERLGVNASYVGRHLNLTLLAPDIVEAILGGTEPDGLSLEKLYRAPVV